MTILSKLLSAFKDWKAGLFGKSKGHGDPVDWVWANDPFYTEENRKTEKLASLARYITDARALVERRKKAKKKHSDVLAAIVQAQNERLQIESGLRVWSPEFGAWVLKEKA